jgi:hypothetical protein
LSAPIPTLFAFGTLRVPQILEGVLEHPLGRIELLPAAAPGFRTVYYPGRTYPALIEAARLTAEGTAVRGLSAADLRLLDLFEGTEYVRKPIAIVVGGETIPAEYYWATASIAPDAPEGADPGHAEPFHQAP